MMSPDNIMTQYSDASCGEAKGITLAGQIPQALTKGILQEVDENACNSCETCCDYAHGSEVRQEAI
ncbi:hypothetical protein HKX49_06430 [Sulfitobacter sp. M51]|uniref:hypothetical protein n=1 Tax=unclassified Sulfitobacter TaxID=196795 RepID=UPI0023E126A4|nr:MULTISPECIES: hypothetical protein [unclassified Sulfitobacter]MDF3493214.1 hypothetical protein [Sulfitobacter sp. M51]MDF3532226.1 hypothetical protein [Sulfitobacter sp. S62]